MDKITVQIQLLGRFALRLKPGEELTISSRKARALIAILALTDGEPVPREKITSLLWSDRGEQQARSSLRQALTEVRKALPNLNPPLLIADRDTVCIDPESIKVDAVTFGDLFEQGTPAALERAAELYRGDLLEGSSIQDPAFEDWLRDERQRLRERAIDALSRLLDHQAVDDAERAVATAQRLLALDPLREATHRVLMKIFDSKGERTLALKQYQACRNVLYAELEISPNAETEKLAEEIRGGTSGPGEDAGPTPEPRMLRTEPFPLPDKPSIAVLPFVNMSGDAEQEYLADGITEDIITELSRFRSLFIIVRNSSFHYKGQSLKVQDVGHELGVRYVVEGSVRRAGNRARVTAQLVDAATGNHVWAERYDRDLEDIFSVQDEVVREIVTAVPAQLELAEIQRIQRRPADNLTAYEYLMRAVHIQDQDWGSPDAVVLLEKAIDADAHYALAYARLANWHAYSILAHGAPADEARQLTINFAEKAIHLDPTNSTNMSVIGEAYLMSGDLELARQNIDKAIMLNPNDYNVMANAGVIFANLGDIEEALRWDEKIIRHDPFSPGNTREASLEIYYLAGRYEDAINCFTGWHNPPRHSMAQAAAAYAQGGRHDEAAELRERYEATLPPDYTFAKFLAAQMKMCALQKHRDMWLEGYRKAGFEV